MDNRVNRGGSREKAATPWARFLSPFTDTLVVEIRSYLTLPGKSNLTELFEVFRLCTIFFFHIMKGFYKTNEFYRYLFGLSDLKN